MRNILLIIPYGSVGGIERLAFTFYEYYKKEGYNVKAIKLIQLQSDIIHFGEDEIAFSKIDFAEMTFFNRFFFYAKIPWLIRRIIKKYQITDSISFGDMTNVFSSLSLTKEYKIASIHALKSVEFVNKTFLNKVFKTSFKTSYFFFNKVVCISEAIKKDLIENCGFKFKNKIAVIYNPHNIQEIERLSDYSLDSEEETNLFKNNVILFLGRMSLQKSPWFLIKAFSLLENSNNDIKLVFIGDGDKKITEYLNELITNYNVKENVVFLGRKSNPYKYLNRARVLALSSYYEGTPNVIVEALATGTPIVSSNCTEGIKELMSIGEIKNLEELMITESGIITPNFFKGFLEIDKNEAITVEDKFFAKALQMVLNDNSIKENLIKNRNKLLKKFDLQNVAIKYLS